MKGEGESISNDITFTIIQKSCSSQQLERLSRPRLNNNMICLGNVFKPRFYILYFLKKTCSCVYLIALSHTVLLAACRSYSIHGLRKRICFSLEGKQEGIESSYYMQTRPGTFSLIIFFDAVYTSWGKNSNTGNFCTLGRRVLLNGLSSLRWMPSSHKIWSHTMAKCEWVSMHSPKKNIAASFLL